MLQLAAIPIPLPEAPPLPTWTGWCLGLAPGRASPRYAARPRRLPAAPAHRSRHAWSPPGQREIQWPIPFAPSRLHGASLDSKVRLSWAAAGGGAETYTVKRSLSPGGPYEVIGEGVKFTRGTNPTVTPGTTYYYTVSARNNAGEGPDSAELAVYVPTPSETLAELWEDPPKENHRERAERLAQLDLAHLDLPLPEGGAPDPALLQLPKPKPVSYFATKKLALVEIETGRLLAEDEIPRPSFPSCVTETTPCYFARCRHSLLTDVNRFGSLKINFPGWDVDQVPATCSIREARKGPQNVEVVAEAFNLTPEAIRQVERDAWRKLNRRLDPQRIWQERPAPAADLEAVEDGPGEDDEVPPVTDGLNCARCGARPLVTLGECELCARLSKSRARVFRRWFGARRAGRWWWRS